MVQHNLKKRTIRKRRIKTKIIGTSSRPRLSVFRSEHHLFVQLIDDQNKKTLIGLSDMVLGGTEKNKITRAHLLGMKIAEEAKKKRIAHIVFDRNGYAYHGRVKALSEGLRKGGLAH
ncbi:50S ribosomal protein L18 [Candidatus Gottesmanbacteria bacterium]|nr:50S ribosomal protein L18 [Candidatus Gottesmanbacteria bacterium]